MAQRTARKTANGLGTIRKRPDGRWEARVTLGRDEEGKQLRRSVYGRTQDEVKERLIELRGQVKAGIASQRKGRAPTVKTYLEEWLQRCDQGLGRRKTGVGPETARRYRELMTEYVIPVLGAVQITKLTPEQVEKMLGRVIESGRAQRTAGHVRTVLRTALNHAVEREIVARNVASIAHVPVGSGSDEIDGEDESGADMHLLDETQARTLIEKSAELRDGPLYTFLLSTGLRLGEALALRWSDLNEKTGALAVRRQLKRRERRYVLVGYLKTGRGQASRKWRTLRLNTTARNALEQQRAQQAADRAAAGERWTDDETTKLLIFRTALGEPVNGPSFTHRFEKWLAETTYETAGPGGKKTSRPMPVIRIHDLRHTYATIALSNGVPVNEVSEQLGHSTPSVTWNVYGHVLPKGRESMAAVMDSAFGATR